ncbi:MAG: PRC-barrel domain-containing protein [Nitrosopumilaceae archaeon]|jgi:sporulation protein YlmC with PRC-barrel domain
MSTKLEGMPENITTADNFIGKRVVDREGIHYGKVKHIHFNSETMTVSGVTIHEGFRKDYYLSNDYFDKFTEKTLLLNIPPVRKDSDVVDIDGKKLGKIKKLHRHPDTNQLETIEVSDGLIHSKVVSKAHIWGVGEKVILKMTKDQYRNLE